MPQNLGANHPLQTPSTTTTLSSSAGPVNISFSFINDADVLVFLGGTLRTNGTGSDNYTINTAKTQVTFNNTVSGDVIITRKSDLLNKVRTFTAGSSVRAADLNTQFDQVMQLIQDNYEVLRGIVQNDANDELTVGRTLLIKDDAVVTNSVADGSITTVKLAADAVDGTKIADNAINSEHYTDGSIDRVHLSNDIIDGTKLADDSVDSEHYVDGSIDAAHIADGAVQQNKIATGAVTQVKINSSAVGEDELINSAVTTAKLAPDAVVASKIADNAVTTDHIADAELTELATMGSATAAALADLTGPEVQTLDGVTSTTAELNILDGVTATASEINILDGVTSTATELNILDGATVTATELNTLDGVNSTLTAAELNQLDGNTLTTSATWTSNVQFPSAANIDQRITDRLAPIGGFEAIADDESFPNTVPPEGAVVSIANAGGLTVNGSGVSTNGDTLDNTTVTINNFPTGFNNTTVADGLGLLVTKDSGAGHTYDFHRVVASDEDVRTLGDQVNDFVNRYRTGNTNPTSDNDPGDLFYNTGNDTMFVRNGANNAWEQVQSIGNFFVIPATELADFADGSASVETISNAPTNSSQIILSINGVIQEPNATGTQASPPTDGFALDGNVIVLSATPPNPSDVWGVIIGSTVNTGTPSDNTVDADILQTDAVTTVKIQNLAVTTAKLADDSVTAAKLADSTDTDADRAVTRNHIRNDAIDGTKIADDAVDSEHIANGAVDLAHMSANSVDSDQYVDGSIDTAHIANNQITTALLGPNCVTRDEILDGEVTHVKIANDAVDGDNIAADVALTGNPTAATQTAGNNTTRIATTAFVTTAVAAVNTDLVNDTSPQLGGNLDVNGNQIVSASNGDISIQPNGTGTVEVKRASSALNTLTDGATIAVDLSLANNHTVTLGGNRTLGNPTNAEPGQTGSIFIVQDGTGSRTLTPAANWHFAKGGAHPTFSTAANAVDRIDYIVRTSTSIHCVATFNYS